MEEYRKYVEKISNSTAPSETIMNRSSEHASVVIEFLFRKALAEIDILTSELAAEVYGAPSLIAAATDFLKMNDGAKIRILAETDIDRASHPFLKELDTAGLGGQVSLAILPENVRRTYQFNFAVTDDNSYRFEESRNSREAIVRFSDTAFGNTLRSIFQKLAHSAKEKAPA